MKIAIASDDGKTISSHFGKTKGFVIFEVEGKKVKNEEYRPNTLTGHAKGLEGMTHQIDKHVSILNALKDCKTVISGGMGKRIYSELKKAGMEVFVTEETDVKNALELYLKGELIDRPELGCPHKHE